MIGFIICICGALINVPFLGHTINAISFGFCIALAFICLMMDILK